MSREMEYAKGIALLCKMYKMHLLTEEEFNMIRNKLKERYLVV